LTAVGPSCVSAQLPLPMPHGKQARLCTCRQQVRGNGHTACRLPGCCGAGRAGWLWRMPGTNPYSQLCPNPVPARRGRWLARRQRPCPTGMAPSAACWAWRSAMPRRASRRRSGAPPRPVEQPRSGRTCVVGACTASDSSGLSIACALCSVQQSGHVRAFGPDSLPASGVFACLACQNCNATELPVTDCACQVDPDPNVKSCLCCMWPVS